MSLKDENEYLNDPNIKADLRGRSIKGAGATLFGQVINYIIQFVSTIILARILTPTDFGLVSMVLSVFVFFRICRNFGLTDATIQIEKISHEQISTLFWINVFFSLTITLIFIGIAPFIVWFYNEPELKLIAIIISLDFFLGGISSQHRALLKRNLFMYRFASNEIIGTFISFSAAIVLALYGWGYWALVARYVIFAVSETVGAWLFCPWRPGLPRYGTGIRPMLYFGANMLGNFSVSYFTQNLDKILIGWRFGSQSLGYYSRAYHLFMAPAQQLSYPLTGVAVATLSKLLDEPEEYRKYYLKAVSLLSFVGMLLSLMLTVMGYDIILLLLGEQWVAAGKIFSVFGVGIGVQILYSTHSWIHISLGYPDRWFRWGIISAIIFIISFFAGLPFGPIGVAFAYIISLYALVGPSLWYAGRPIQLGFGLILSAIWKYCLSALLSGLLIWFLLYSYTPTSHIFINLNIFVRLLSASFVCLVCYLVMVITIFNNFSPIIQFTSVLRDMNPKLKR